LSTSGFFGILLLAPVLLAQTPAHLDPATSFSIPGEFHSADPFHPQIGDAESGVMPLVPDWPQSAPPRPVSGVVSLQELQHPVPKKALKAAFKAQQFSKKHKIAQAIVQLQKAIAIDPSYRDAHCNLGVQYARLGRLADARAEFEKALKIGPPAALIYSDLALSFEAGGDPKEAGLYARKALALDPRDPAARRLVTATGH
jgi:Tfp pilus assembly protein PilF